MVRDDDRVPGIGSGRDAVMLLNPFAVQRLMKSARLRESRMKSLAAAYTATPIVMAPAENQANSRSVPIFLSKMLILFMPGAQ